MNSAHLPPHTQHAGRAGGCVVAVAGGGQAWSDCVVSCDTHHPPQIGENWTKLYCLLNLEIIIKCVCDHEWEPQLGTGVITGSDTWDAFRTAARSRDPSPPSR